MTIYHNEKPYYDNTKQNLQKGYNTLVAIPGRTEQAREFTELQSTIYSHLQRLGDTVHSDGDRVKGCTLIISGTKATITSGSIYLDGLVRDTNGGSLTITGVGQETIGIKLSSKLVTEADDSSLYDPAQESNNYGQPGTYRQQDTIQFVLNDPNATPLYVLSNGSPLTTSDTTDMDKVTNLLAERTWDEAGNYKVNGLDVSAVANESILDKIPLQLSTGKAYIKGYEINKLVSTPFTVDTSTDYDTANNEIKRYVKGTLIYALNNPSVRSIDRVTMSVYTKRTVTRGAIPGGKDSLSDTKSSVMSILDVSDSSRSYKYGKDYVLDDNNSTINWSVPAGNEPSTGSSYTVTMIVLEDLDPSMYSLGNASKGTKDKLVLTASAPVPYVKENTQFNGTFTVEYEFYYVRRDLILLDQKGDISVLKGRPNLLSRVNTPSNQDESLLAIASVQVSPIDNSVDIINSDEVRLTMDDLYRLSKRLDEVESNQAQQDLDRAAQAGEDATRLSGIFTDGFLNINKADISHKDFLGSIDLDKNEFTVPSNQDVVSLKINQNDVSTDVGVIGRVISAPYVPHLSLYQNLATEATRVNEYAVYNPLAIVKLDPTVDNWVDESKIVVNSTETETETLYRWWYHGGAADNQQQYQAWVDAGFEDGGESLGWDSGSASKTTVTDTTDLDEAIFYMRTKTINVTGSNFLPNSDNISCKFNNIGVTLTPTGSSSAGTNAGTVKADTTGGFTAQFTIPSNVQCGTVEVVFSSPDNYGSTSYTANGRLRHVTESVLTTITNVTPTDPLAETFQYVDTDSTVMQAGLFFATKDSSKNIIIEVRDTVNGYPGAKVYARSILTPDQITTSTDASIETKVLFNQPVLCDHTKQYSLAIISDSNEYSVYTATRGSKIIGSDTTVITNPYTDGVLFSSSNGLAWDAKQTQDLKFNLYDAQYNPNGGVVVFDDVSGDLINRILLASDYVDQKNAGITWEYSIDDGKTWDVLDNFVDQDLSQTTRKISLKATIKVTNNMSPIIAGDSINLVTFLDGQTASYVSRNITTDVPYTKLRVSVVSNYQFDPSISMSVYYASDINGTTWIELTKPKVKVYNSEFNQFDYNLEGIPQETNYRVKVVMKTANVLVRPRLKSVSNIAKF